MQHDIFNTYRHISEKEREKAIYYQNLRIFSWKTKQFQVILIGFHLNNFKDQWRKQHVIHQAGDTDIGYLYFFWQAKYHNQVLFPACAQMFQA